MGKSSISMGHLYHGYVSHNQRVHPFHKPVLSTSQRSLFSDATPPRSLRGLRLRLALLWRRRFGKGVHGQISMIQKNIRGICPNYIQYDRSYIYIYISKHDSYHDFDDDFPMPGQCLKRSAYPCMSQNYSSLMRKLCSSARIEASFFF